MHCTKLFQVSDWRDFITQEIGIDDFWNYYQNFSTCLYFLRKLFLG